MELTKILQPCDPLDFVGMHDELNTFANFSNDLKKGKTQYRSLLVIGDDGTGKSSLLLKFADSLVSRKEKKHVFSLIPEIEALRSFFRDWKNKIDELTPEWRSFLEKMGKKPLGSDIPLLGEKLKIPHEASYTEFFVTKFFENLDKVDQKLKSTGTFLYFFIDNFHLFKLTGMHEAYAIFSTIIRELSVRKYNIAVIIAFNEKFLYEFDYEKFLTTNSLLIKLEPLSVTEAEIYLRRKYPTLMRKGLREIIFTSKRTFFDLNFGAAYIDAGLPLSAFVERDIKQLFNLSETEEDVLEELASYNDNLFPVKQVITYVPKDALKSLAEKGLLWLGKEYCRFHQESILQALQFHVRLYSPLTIAITKLDEIENDVSNNIVPLRAELEKIATLAKKIRESLSVFVITTKVKEIINKCIKRGFYQLAYDLGEISGYLFENSSDFEQAAQICEEVARSLEGKDHYLSANLYLKAAEYYMAADAEQKANRSYTRAAEQFSTLAFKEDVEQRGYAVRAHIRYALECYKKTGDKANFEKLRNKALNLFPKESIHREFLSKLSFEETALIVEEPAHDKEEKTKISIEDLQKELEF